MAQKKESLKFPDEIKDKYYASVVLAEDRKDDFQLLIASQLYGTFFGVYGKFIAQCNKGKATVSEVVFRIINYKGIINLGIADIDFKKIQGRFTFTITLKGLGPIVQSVSFIPSTGPLILDHDTEIIVRRELKPFLDNPKEEIFTSGTFEEEFYFRDGLFPLHAPNAALEKKLDEIERKLKAGIGARCPKGIVRIICH